MFMTGEVKPQCICFKIIFNFIDKRMLILNEKAKTN